MAELALRFRALVAQSMTGLMSKALVCAMLSLISAVYARKMFLGSADVLSMGIAVLPMVVVSLGFFIVLINIALGSEGEKIV